MARLEITLGSLSGKLGNIAFRSWGGKTYMYSRPSRRRKQSAAQKEHCSKFREVAIQAKFMLKDSKTLDHYRQEAKRLRLPNAYTAAVSEMMRKK